MEGRWSSACAVLHKNPFYNENWAGEPRQTLFLPPHPRQLPAFLG